MCSELTWRRSKMKYKEILTNGLFKENPIFRLLLGMCPTLAVTTSVENGLGMGLAATVVLIGSNTVVSLIRKVVPAQVRIPCYIVVIASFVTIVELLMKAYLVSLYESLGIFIPLIVVNCIILGRAEAFAAKNTVVASIVDAIGMGLGFTLGLVIISFVRQYSGMIVSLAIQPAGGFIIFGMILALVNHITRVVALKNGKPEPTPIKMDCRHCIMGCKTKK